MEEPGSSGVGGRGLIVLAVQYVRSVPRYLAARYVVSRMPGLRAPVLSPVRLAEVDPPSLPGPQWARLRPILSGICGSDLATVTAEGSTYFSPFVSTPFVFGHEIVATVEEAGPEIQRVAVGDRVVLHPSLHCAIRGIVEPCEACRTGDTAHCRNLAGGVIGAGFQTGYCRDTGGGWSRSLVAHEVQLQRVPDAVADEAAVLIEPYSCCLHAVGSAAGSDAAAGPLGEGGTVLVLGCGSIGLLTIAALRATAVQPRVVAAAKYPRQREEAHRLGADAVVPPTREAIAAALDAELHPTEIGPPIAVGGADVTFDCVGSGRTLDDAMRFTRARGTVVVVGMPGVPKGVDWTAMWHKELVLRGSYTCDDETFVRAVDHVTEKAELLAPLVSARYPLEEYREAIRAALDAGRRGLVKVVFEPR